MDSRERWSRVFEQALELVAGAAKCQILVGRVVIHGHRLMMGKPGFHRATHVGIAGLVTVLLTHMHFNAGDVVLEAAQGLIEFGVRPAFKRFTGLDGVVGVDLNLHVFFSFQTAAHGKRERAARKPPKWGLENSLCTCKPHWL
jgi:hypothetical protein